MAIQRIPTGVAGRIGEPTAIDARFGVKNVLRGLDPIDLFGRFSPKIQRITLPSSIGLSISANHVTSHSVSSRFRHGSQDADQQRYGTNVFCLRRTI
jgi:hypothetical protein